MDIFTPYPRRFLATDENLGDPAVLRAAYERLLALPVGIQAEVDCWLAATNEIDDVLDEIVSKANFAFSCNTADEAAEKEFQRLIDEILPINQEMSEKVNQVFLAIPAGMLPSNMSVRRKKAEWEVEIYRDANIPLTQEANTQTMQYDKMVGSWRCDWEGKQVTPQFLSLYLTKPDRSLREKAYRAQKTPFRASIGKQNELYKQMMKVRKQMAVNSDMGDFMHFMYKGKGRLSYTPEDTKRFRDAIRQYVTPLVSRIFEKRAKMMGIESIRPWDLQVEPEGKEPPVVYSDMKDLKQKTARLLHEVDPAFSEAFLFMDFKGLLDLDNRENKAPGAYCSTLGEMRLPLIFANSVGTARDLDTVIHEGGHAMHSLLARALPNNIRHAPMEFCEVASMSLELLVRPFALTVYKEEDWKRIARKQLEDALVFLPFMSMIDEFQSWVYIDPAGEKPEARAEYWRDLDKKYRPYINWEGFEDVGSNGWMYNHVFTVPFYYIEYGVAQIGALQIFLRSLENYKAAVDGYQKALSLGGSVGLPELFETAGVRFVLKHPEVLADVVDKISKLIDL